MPGIGAWRDAVAGAGAEPDTAVVLVSRLCHQPPWVFICRAPADAIAQVARFDGATELRPAGAIKIREVDRRDRRFYHPARFSAASRARRSAW